MSKRTRTLVEEEEVPLLVADVIPLIYREVARDPIALLKLLKCSKSMLLVLEPYLNEIFANIFIIIASRIENGNWNGIDFNEQPYYMKSLKEFLDDSYQENTSFSIIQRIFSSRVTKDRENTVFLLSLMKRALLEDEYLFIIRNKMRVNRFHQEMNSESRVGHVYKLIDEGKDCVPLLKVENVKIALDLDRKQKDSRIIVAPSIEKEECPLQRILLWSLYSNAKATTTWQKMALSYTLTSNKQKLSKAKRKHIISQVVIPSKDKHIHIFYNLNNYFLFTGKEEDAKIAVKLNYNRVSILKEIANNIYTLSKKRVVVDLTL